MVILPIVLTLLAQPMLRGQTPRTETLIVSVIDSLSRAPLPNADITDLTTGQHRITDDRRVYPFEATVERRSAAIPQRGDVRRIVVAKEKLKSEEMVNRYRPGNVVDRRFGGFRVPILNISTLADSVFWDHHCFRARGFGWYQGDRVVRLEFSPTRDVEGTDYTGSAVLDSATSMLLRVEFQLANARGGEEPTRLDGYTTFMSPSPFVVLPDSTVAVWWMRNPDKDEWGKPDYAQSLHIETMKYRKETPPTYGEAKQP